MTLIELLVVIGILGILAVIVIPRFTGARERAYVAVMQADLSQLRISQEMYRRSASQVYADDLSDLTTFRPSPEVTITLLDRGELEWGAQASHANTSRVCRYESVDRITACDPENEGDPPSPPEEEPDEQGDDDGGEEEDDQGEESDSGWPWK